LALHNIRAGNFSERFEFFYLTAFHIVDNMHFRLVLFWFRGTNYKKIQQKQLTWYGHVQRMTEGSLPKIALKWMPKQIRARGRPKKNWVEGIRKAMNERNLNEGQWEDRKQWSLGV